MPIFDGENLLIMLDDPTASVLDVLVQRDLYSEWKVWTAGKVQFDTETDVNGTTERVTVAKHSQNTGNAAVYSKLGGAEAIGLTDGTTYYIRNIDDDTFELYDTKANAEGGPATTGRIDLTASGVGNGETHQLLTDTSKFPIAFRTVGGDDLTPGVQAGAYFFLQNQLGWRIVSSDEDQTINYSGNLVGEDATISLINSTPGRTVLHLGLQPVTQRVDEILTATQLQAYDGAVSIDTAGGGVSGTTFPVGTSSVPVDNKADALVIAAENNFRRFTLVGSLTLDAATGNTTWEGLGTTASINFNGQDISGTTFRRLGVFGTIVVPTSLCFLEECTIATTVTNFAGVMSDCVLDATTVLATGNTDIYNCTSGIPGSSAPVIDANGQTGVALTVRNYNGGIELQNATQSDFVATIGFNTGRFTVNANCTNASDIQVRGVGSLNNLSAIPDGIGQTIDTTGLISNNGAALAVWDAAMSAFSTSGSAGETLRTLEKIFTNDATVAFNGGTGENEVTIFDDDGVTVLRKMSITTDGLTRTVLVGS